jgi:polar amino acid transport system substrate-binding protein
MNQHRIFKMAAVVAAGSLIISACGSDDDDATTTEAPVVTEAPAPEDTAPPATDAPADTAAPGADLVPDGVLDVGTAIGNPPWAFVVEGQEDPSGFDMELIQALGERLGVEVNIQVADFPSLIPSLESGRYDVVVSSLTIREDRLEVINMLAYMKIATGILVQAGNPAGLTGLEDACGLRVGVAQGSANEEPVAEASEACGDNPIEVVSTQGNDFVALQSGQVDLMVLDAAGAFFTETERGDTFEALSAVYGEGLAGIATAKENTALAEALQAELLAMIESGEYDDLVAEWNLSDIAHTGAELNPTQ